jgi:DNA-3-methyladenine glycosylase
VVRHVLDSAFYRRDVLEVAPALLNKVLVLGPCAGRVVEVEAYRQDDPASHSYRGPTERNRVMFGEPGHLYVYLSYGVHWCCNVVCGDVGYGAAVLVRALRPLDGLDRMFARRPRARGERDLCSGPGKLTQALGITRDHNGASLAQGEGPLLLDDGTLPPAPPASGPRIGISKAVEQPWRFWVAGDEHLSTRR